jgi:hypothetical protein
MDQLATTTRSQELQAHSLLRRLMERKYRRRQHFLWEGCNIAVPGTFGLVYANEFTGESYQKIVVLASGEVYCNVTLPALLWLGEKHVCGELRLLDDIDLMVLYNADASQPSNAWWDLLRRRYKQIADNVIYGDIVFARKGDDVGWQKNTFMALVARSLAAAK